MCLTFAGYADIWQRLLVPMSKVVLQKASVKDKIITFESSLIQVFGCGSIKMLHLKSKKWGQRGTSSAVHLCCKRNTSK
jgi:hypothetical protein